MNDKMKLQKLGWFFIGIIVGVLFTYSLLDLTLNLPEHIYLIGFLCILIQIICFREEEAKE